jgi:hypothetical protein
VLLVGIRAVFFESRIAPAAFYQGELRLDEFPGHAPFSRGRAGEEAKFVSIIRQCPDIHAADIPLGIEEFSIYGTGN